MERNKAQQQHYTTNPSTAVNTTPSLSPSKLTSPSTLTSASKPSLPPKPPLPPNESAGGSQHIVFPPPVFSAATSPLQPVRRKKGRPRKYGSSDQAMAANPKPQQLSLGAGTSLSRSSEKPQPVSLGAAVQGFIPHVINVVAGEDVGQKITMFMQQSKRELCILSASGTISNPSLYLPATSGGNIAFEGRFDILSLSGSYVRTETGGTSGGLSVCLSSADGRVIGGGVGGPLKAASPVLVTVATFMIDRKKDVSANAKGDASGSKLPSSVVGTTNVSFRPAFEAPGRNPIDAFNVGFPSPFEARGRNPIDASGSKLPSSVAGSSVSNVSFPSPFEARGRDLIDVSGSKLPSSVAGSSVSNVSFPPAFEAPGRNTIDANDDHQSFRGSHFMTQPQGQHLASRPTDWRTGLDDRTAFELTGKTGHGAHHRSPESRDHD
ncbi:hypothetical protein HRI_001586600 [Hibiscus trionum]|uniref:AT-hook motif nuclear-localized protein n=1 Tax=Hibiscus trionum TaxID=183268 RepID=A0A9W7LVH1_HIBTR|nr:hypothetical protein HRI_001586600 [Hibiscus trionum]